MNHKRLRRVYREERLQVRRRSGRKRALGTRAPMTMPQAPNQRWSLDFLSDTLTDERRFSILAVSMTSPGSASPWWPTLRSPAPGSRELDVVIAERGKPRSCARG